MTNELLGPLVSLFGGGSGFGRRVLELNLVAAFLLMGALLLNRICEPRIAASVRVFLFLAIFARVFLGPLMPATLKSPLGLFGTGAPVTVPANVMLDAPLLLVPAPGAPVAFTPSLSLALLYGLGVAALLGRWVWARVALARQLHSARVAAGPWHALCGVPVQEHESLGPLVAGLWRPRVVLPRALLAKASGEELAFVLGHEGAHVRRRDHLLVPLVQLLTIFAWPIFPLWLAARQVRGLVELACDESVLAGRNGQQRRRYGELLVTLAGGGLVHSPLAPSFGWELRERVRALRGARRWRLGAQALVVGTVGTVLLACSGSPGSEETPPDEALQEPAEAGRNPILTITKEGGLYLGRKRIEPATLEAELRAALTAGGSETLLIRGDKEVMLGSAVDVMSAAKRAGARSINILSDPTPTLFTPATPPPGQGDDDGDDKDTAYSRGSMDPQIVRKVIAANIGKVKGCYEKGLARVPTMGGRLVTSFTIGAKGKVTESEIRSSTLNDSAVAACVDGVVRKMVFPPPDGGIVVVQYPFLFAPSE